MQQGFVESVSSAEPTRAAVVGGQLLTATDFQAVVTTFLGRDSVIESDEVPATVCLANAVEAI